jgi:hypothetical protein
MSDGYQVNPDQLHQLSARFAAFVSEFDDILSASQAIAQDDEAYGLLCSWMPPILEGRHEAFDELMRFGQENMTLLSEALRSTAESYENADEDAMTTFEDLSGSLE